MYVGPVNTVWTHLSDTKHAKGLIPPRHGYGIGQASLKSHGLNIDCRVLLFIACTIVTRRFARSHVSFYF